MDTSSPDPSNPYAPGAAGAPGQMLKPGRGAMILVFGLLGVLVCFIFGIFAWVMGKQDIEEMNAGRMDPNELGLTKAGYILGIISCVLALLALAAVVVWFLIVGGLMAGALSAQ